MRYTSSSIGHLLTGSILTVGVVWLGLLAAAHDGYYQGSVSRWEHATRGGSGPVVFVVLGLVLAGGFAAACVVPGLLPTRRSRALSILLALPFYAFGWVMAWFGLGGGH